MFLEKQREDHSIRNPSIVYRATLISFLVSMLNQENDKIRYIARNSFCLDFKKCKAKRSVEKYKLLGCATSATSATTLKVNVNKNIPIEIIEKQLSHELEDIKSLHM